MIPLILAAGLAGAQTPPSADVLAKADYLYFHRHQDANLAGSVSLLETELKKNPKRPDLLWRLGRSMLRQGEKQDAKPAKLAAYARAEDLLRQAVALAPREPQAHYWLGIAIGRRGQARGVLNSLFLIGPVRREMRSVLELDPQNGGAHHVLGEMLFEIPAVAGGDKKAAVRELETAARLEPDCAPHFLDLAEAYAAVGRKDQSKAALEHVLSIREPADPGEFDENMQDAREMLRKLSK